jgi:hypothetical protein
MSERNALSRFYDWRAARDRKAATAPRFAHRRIRLVAVPLSSGLATVVLATGNHASAPGGSQWRRTSAPAVDLP